MHSTAAWLPSFPLPSSPRKAELIEHSQKSIRFQECYIQAVKKNKQQQQKLNQIISKAASPSVRQGPAHTLHRRPDLTTKAFQCLVCLCQVNPFYFTPICFQGLPLSFPLSTPSPQDTAHKLQSCVWNKTSSSPSTSTTFRICKGRI